MCVCLSHFFSSFLVIDNRQGSFNCVDCLIVMETVEKYPMFLVSNCMCGLYKFVCKMKYISAKNCRNIVLFFHFYFQGSNDIYLFDICNQNLSDFDFFFARSLLVFIVNKVK